VGSRRITESALAFPPQAGERKRWFRRRLGREDTEWQVCCSQSEAQ
jgi:hypothetical protein